MVHYKNTKKNKFYKILDKSNYKYGEEVVKLHRLILIQKINNNYSTKINIK